MKLCSDETTKKAFVMYVLGSVQNNGFIKHNKFESDNGMIWAKDIIESAFTRVVYDMAPRYQRKGAFNVYAGQELTPENGVFMDMFEVLMFGDYDVNANRAVELPDDVADRLRISFQTIFRLLSENGKDARQEKRQAAKLYNEAFVKKVAPKSPSSGTTEWGIGWLKFYVNWRFPLGFVFGVFSILSGIIQASNGGYLAESLFIIALVIDIGMYFYRVVVYAQMRQMTELGYTMNHVLLVFEAMLSAVRLSLSYADGSIFDFFDVILIYLVFAFLIWWLPNFIYFRHRRDLFDASVPLEHLEHVSATSKDDKPPVYPEKKFICRACGSYASGWYQNCPKCGAVGKMEQAPPATVPRPEPASSAPENTPYHTGELSMPDRVIAGSSENGEPSISPDTPVQSEFSFCRHCGSKLLPNASFCNQCGTPIIPVSQPLDNDSSQLQADGPEGEPDLPPEETSHAQPPEAPSLTIIAGSVQGDALSKAVEAPSYDLDFRSLTPKLRRAFILTEDEEWEKAELYFEGVLDEEPENPFAYLGKLMIEHHAKTFLDLASRKGAITGNKNYKRALAYAGDELKEALQSLAETM